MTDQTLPDRPSNPSVIHEGLPTQLPDIDPEETLEWLDSFDAMVEGRGRDRARYVMLRLLERARANNVGVPALRSTDYINSIPPEREPWFPGDEDIERRIRAFDPFPGASFTLQGESVKVWRAAVREAPAAPAGQVLEAGRFRRGSEGVEERHHALDDLDRTGRLGRPAGGFGQLDSFIGAV